MEKSAAIELAVLAIQLALQLSVMAQMSEEEINDFFASEYAKLKERDPADLPDV